MRRTVRRFGAAFRAKGEGGSSRDWRFPHRLGAPAAAALVIAGLFGVWGCADDVPPSGSEPAGAVTEGGPLRVPPDNVYYPVYERGDVFTDGFQRLLVSGKEAAVVESVEPIGAQGLEVLDVLYAGTDRRVSAVQVMDGFPPTRRSLGVLHPVEGAIVPPGTMGLELIIGMRVTADGYASRQGLRIRYRVGQDRYVTDFPAGIAVCPPSVGFEACEERWEEQS